MPKIFNYFLVQLHETNEMWTRDGANEQTNIVLQVNVNIWAYYW